MKEEKDDFEGLDRKAASRMSLMAEDMQEKACIMSRKTKEKRKRSSAGVAMRILLFAKALTGLRQK